MQTIGPNTEVPDLRRALRDLVAISMLPAAWSDAAPQDVAQSLAQVLLRTLGLEIAYIQLRRPGRGGLVEAVAAAGPPEGPIPAQEIARTLARWLESEASDTARSVPNPLGSGTLCLAVIPIGYDARSGHVVAASPRPDFPTEWERTLLSVTTNQAFVSLESKWATQDREQLLAREQAARAAAETAQARYGELVNSLDAIVWEADAKTFRFTFVSGRAEDVLGYPVERWLTEPHFWAEHIHPDDRAWAVDYCVRCTAAKEDHQFEYRILAADGRVVWLRDVVNVVLNEAGEPTLLRGVMFDITKQKQAEEARARLAAIVESSQDAIIGKDLNGIITSWNRGAERLFGYTASEAMGQPVTMLFPNDRFDEEPIILARIRRGERIEHYETVRRRKDGTFLDISLTVSPIVDAQGRIVGASKIARDITERKRAEERLQASEAQFRQLANAMPQIIWTARPDGYIDYYNERWYEFTGFPHDEFGQSSWEPILHPGDVQRSMETYFGCIRSGQPYQIEYRFKDRFTGAYRWFMGRALPVRNERGEITRWFGICTDIDDMKRAEEELREQSRTVETINRVSRELAAELDLEKLVQAVTDAATELAGAEFGAFFYSIVDDQGEAHQLYTLAGAGKEAFAYFPLWRDTPLFGPTFRGQGVVRLDDVTQDPRYGKNAPYYDIRPGHLPVRSYLAAPLISRPGEVIGGLCLGHSRPGVFTERAEQLVAGIAAQAAVAMDNARLYREAQQAVRVRDEFLATVSHDLKNPLGALKGTAQLLQRRLRRAPLPEAEPLADGLARIDDTATRMARMINSLLDITRLQMGQSLPLDRQPTDLVALARGVAARCQEATEQHALDVRAAAAEVVGQWDRDRLERVLENLLSNAIKYSPEGGEITITVAQEMDGQEPWAVLRVQDRGVGIPAADLPRLFARFERGRNVQGQIAGTGLGLVATRQIVEQHQGRIELESQESVGTTVTLRLPLALDHPSDRISGP